MEEVQAVHCQDDHGTIHSIEVKFGGDDPARPAVGELNGSVHGSDVEGESAESGTIEHCLHVLVHEIVAGWWFVIRALEGPVGEVAEDELDGKGRVDGDCDHLEDNTAQHDSTAHVWVLVVSSGNCGKSTTDTLNSEGDNICGEEDDGIWR